MKIAALFCLSVLLAGSTSCAMGRGGGTSPARDAATPKNSLQLIAQAVERGEIDEDTATLYRVYSVLDASKLPPQYRGTAPIKDGTPVLRDARSRYEALSPEIREKLKPYLFPRGRR